MEEQLTASERYYQNHLSRMREYNKKNKEAIKERNRQHYTKMTKDPEKHAKYLERKRELYRLRKLKNKQDSSDELEETK